MRSAKDTKRIRSLLLTWYEAERRPFPWRLEPPDAYVVLVSEIMLQQTQASRVAELLPPFLERYPTVHALADASTADVIRAWKGLGYNNRAVRLRDAARIITTRFDGNIPEDEDDLRSLPGLGAYASAAVSCFAYGHRTIVVDVNVRRVYSRLLALRATTIDMADDVEVRAFAEAVIPQSRPDTWHHAVMDLGARLCTARNAACAECPLQEICPSAHSMIPAVKPRSRERLVGGYPLRIWRGRVVEVLRGSEGDVGTDEVLFQVLGETTNREHSIAEEVLERLERDGIIELRDGRVRLKT